jgi:hypothetical protein
MPISSESLIDAHPFHDDEGGTVGQTPSLVRTSSLVISGLSHLEAAMA